jgi:gliding motility-associated-like protein
MLPVQWLADPAQATIVATTDSSARLVFKTAGAVVLRAVMTVNCRIIRDSIVLHAIQSPAKPALGPDIALCKQSTVLLHAGGGFKSYLWQNGTVDSVLTAYLPGMYYVNTRDYCDHAHSDTINISQAPDIPFSLGPDTVVCRTDTLVLTAPAGFSGYSWAPAYGADHLQQAAVRLYPNKDISYTCTATKGPGCQVMDSVHITVKDLPQHFLSPADAVCVGKQLELHASGSWPAYKWFDNSTGETAKVSAAGVYSLQVTDTNGCKGKDSITVMPGSCAPGVYFPNAFSPDHNGKNDVFRPVVSVALDEYYLVVYDRLGEKVFETKDVIQGWDGLYKGKAPATGAFVWYARYHVQGSAEKTKVLKGTVVLVR